MQPRDRLSVKEIEVATMVWQGLTNKEIAALLHTSEQVVKNYLRTTFDKLGVWTRLELALYVASHGGATWQPRTGLVAGQEPWRGPGQDEIGISGKASVAAASGGIV
jgi:DNA-binding CsgD family transcriptional regulator